MVPGSYPAHNLRESRNITLWFCSCYIMSGMALTAMCFNILHDEIVHRLNHAEKQDMLKATMSIDELSSTDPFVVTSWQFPNNMGAGPMGVGGGGTLCRRNMTDEGLMCGMELPAPFTHDNDLNIMKDPYNQVDVTRDCKPILKLEDHLRPLPPPAVFTLPEVDEDMIDEENTEM